jgi:hypothetical protein
LEDTVKAKVSLTLDDALVAFVDAQPGTTRSQKIETALRRYRDAWRDLKLREELASFGSEEGDTAETAAWSRVMQEGMWRESDGATSGPSRSRRTRSRARR